MNNLLANRILAPVLIVGAVGLFGLSGALLTRAWPALVKAAAHHETQATRVVGQCRNIANKLGYQVESKEGRLNMSVPASQLNQIKQSFDHASAIVAACDGYRLDAFCAGTGCGDKSVFFSLRKVNSVTQSR